MQKCWMGVLKDLRAIYYNWASEMQQREASSRTRWAAVAKVGSRCDVIEFAVDVSRRPIYRMRMRATVWPRAVEVVMRMYQ